LVKGSPSSPPEFWMFIKEVRKQGVSAQLQMQELPIEGVSRSAIVDLNPNQPVFRVVNLFKCDSVESASRVLAELEANPAMSHIRQRNCYVMSVTFMEPDDKLVATVTNAFGAFELPPIPVSY